jgi:hypothetical protein
MVTASPSRGTFPSGQDFGSDQRVWLAVEAGADVGMAMCSCDSWA